MQIGHASVYLPVLHFLLLIYSEQVAAYIGENGYIKLNEQNDYTFSKNVLGVNGVVPRIFDLTPSFKVEEFLAPNCAVERKLNFILQLIETVKAKDLQLSNKRLSEAGLATTPSSGTAASDYLKSGKTKSVTFRKEDSIAGIPSSGAKNVGQTSTFDEATANFE